MLAELPKKDSEEERNSRWRRRMTGKRRRRIRTRSRRRRVA